MKTIEIKLYQFAELSEEGKEQAILKLYDLNVDHEWWNFTFDEAKTIGLEITSFDIGRGSDITGNFINGAEECANLIFKEHGAICDTHNTATEYQKDRDALVLKYSDGVQTDRVSEEHEYEFDCDCDELDKEFEHAILQDYLSILSKEYGYRLSEEAIIETIEANEYDFTEKGKLY